MKIDLTDSDTVIELLDECKRIAVQGMNNSYTVVECNKYNQIYCFYDIMAKAIANKLPVEETNKKLKQLTNNVVVSIFLITTT